MLQDQLLRRVRVGEPDALQVRRGLRRIDVGVRRESDPDGSTLVNLAGFVGATATASPSTSLDWYGAGGPGGPDGEDDGEDEGESGDEDDGDDPGVDG